MNTYLTSKQERWLQSLPKDKYNLPFYIDLDGKIHHPIILNKEYSYENMIKNLDKLSPFGDIIIKSYSMGVSNGYTNTDPDYLLQVKKFREYAKIFNPELTI